MLYLEPSEGPREGGHSRDPPLRGRRRLRTRGSHRAQEHTQGDQVSRAALQTGKIFFFIVATNNS